MQEQNRIWVLIRGLVRGKNHWIDFEKHFFEMYPQDQIYYLEIPGNGTRFREVSPLLFDDLVADFRMQIERLGLKDKKICLLTISLGSMIGLAWLGLHPNDIEKLICINTSSSLSPVYRRMQPRAFFRLLFSAIFSRSTKESVALELTINKKSLVAKLLPMFQSESLQHPVRILNSIRQLRLATSMQLPSLSSQDQKKLLFIASTRDQLVHSSCSVRLAEYYKAPLIVNAVAGHDLPNEEPNWLLEQIRIW